MTDMHYYKFNIADYRKDTTHLNPTEHYIYRSLIDWYYLDEKPIPKETQSVIRRLSLGSDMVNLLNNVLSDFFVLGKNGYVHSRIERDIVEYNTNASKNKANGKLGGRPPKPSPAMKETQSVILANPNESERNPNQEPITNNHKPLKDIRGLRLTNDWEAPQEYIQFCNTERPDLDANMIANIFKDYWIGVAGAKGVKNDWFATWRNWVRRQEQGKSKFKNKSAVMSDSQFDDWLNSTTTEVQHERLA